MLFFDTSMLFWHVDAVLKRQCFSQHVNEFSTCQYFSWYTNAFLNISKLFLTYQCFSQHVDTCQSWWCPDKNCEVLVCFVGFDSFTQKKLKTENCQFLVKNLGLSWLEFGLSLDLELGRWDGDLQP
jgi:hypothetical protein